MPLAFRQRNFAVAHHLRDISAGYDTAQHASNGGGPFVTYSKPEKARTKSAQAKQDAILDAAARQFNALGVKGAQLGEIAANVGMVTSGIAYYYRKKDDLAAACFLRAIAVTKVHALTASAEPDVAARVARLFALHLGELAAMANGEARPLIGFSDILALGEPQLAPVLAAYIDMFRSIRALLADPAAKAQEHSVMVLRAHLVLSLLNAHRDWTHRFEASDYPRVAHLVADVVLNGVTRGADIVLGADPVLPAPPPASDPTAEAFLRAATQLVNDQGYRGASVEKIAAVLDATKGKFYHYNDAKNELITACFERSFDLQRHFLDQAEALDVRGAQRFAALIRALVCFQLSDRGPLLQGSAFSVLPDQQNRAHISRTRQQLDTRIGSILVGGLIDGSVRALDPALTAEVVHAAISAAAELRRWLPRADPASVARNYAQLIICGQLHASP